MEGGEKTGRKEKEEVASPDGKSVESGGDAAGTTHPQPSRGLKMSGSLEGCSVTPSARGSPVSESERGGAVDANLGLSNTPQTSSIEVQMELEEKKSEVTTTTTVGLQKEPLPSGSGGAALLTSPLQSYAMKPNEDMEGGGDDAEGEGDGAPKSEVKNEQREGGARCENLELKPRTVWTQLPPMQNSDILETFFNVCPPDLLLKFRLVSKQWHQESISRFRSSVWVKLDNGHDSTAQLKRFLKYVEDPANNACNSKPYRKFRLVNWNFRENDELIDWFWQACASNITSLELNKCSFDGVEVFRRIVFNSFVNLESLVLVPVGFSGMDPDDEGFENWECPALTSLTVELNCYGQPVPVSWQELFFHFPNLAKLQLESTSAIPATRVIVELLTAMQTIRRQDQRMLQLICLKFVGPSCFQLPEFLPSMSRLFRELQLPLETLVMDFGKFWQPGLFKDIVEVVGMTLRSLTVRRNIDICEYEDGQVLDRDRLQLSNLQLQELRISCVFIENMTLRKFIYDCCPHLRTVELDGYTISTDTDNGPLIQMDHFFKQVPNLASLTIHIQPPLEPLWEPAWVNLFSRFPNLTSLSLESADGATVQNARRRQGVQEQMNEVNWIVEMLTGIRSIRSEEQHKLPLKHLDILHYPRKPLPTKIALLFNLLQLPLESLAMDFGEWWQPHLFKNILEPLGKTLKTLTAIRDPNSNSSKKGVFPFGWQLESLKKLTITTNFLKNLKFCQIVYETCPDLETLEIDGYRLDRTNPLVQQKPGAELLKGFYHLNLEHPSREPLTVDFSWDTNWKPWLHVLYHLPNLTSIKLDRPYLEDNGSVMCDMLEAMQILRANHNRKFQLKHLDIADAGSGAYFPIRSDLFRELQLPLESLKMCFGRYADPPVLREILEVHASTLRSLTVSNYSEDLQCSEFLFGVQLDELEELTFSGSDYIDLNFLDFTPNLRKLVIENDWCPRSTSISFETRYLAPVTEIHLTELFLNQPVGDYGFRSLVERIATVKKLSMYLDDQLFRVVCKAWRNLQHLEVFGCEMTDEGITGIKSQSRNDEKPDERDTCPSITWLNGLTSFTLGVGEIDDRKYKNVCLKWRRDDNPPTYLTDASAFHGFLKLDNLQSLRLRCQMSDEAELALKTKIPHCEIDHSKVRW